MENINKKCKECGKELYLPNKTGFCFQHSRPKKGQINSGCFKKGNKLSEETKKRIGEAMSILKLGKKRKPFSKEWKEKLSKSLSISQKRGEKSINWKGDKAKYKAKHCWIIANYGHPIKCEDCGKVGTYTGRSWNIHWSNKDHLYRRVREDYTGRCQKCHIKYDRKNKINKKYN